MYTIHIPDQIDGAYNCTIDYDTLDAALDVVSDAVTDVFAHHAVLVTHDGSVVGAYWGDIVRCDDTLFPRTDFGHSIRGA